jgi:hypothetical protein
MIKPPFESVVTSDGAPVLRACLAVLGPGDTDDAWSEIVMSQDIEDTANLRTVRGVFLWPARSLAGGLVVAVGVEDQLA